MKLHSYPYPRSISRSLSRSLFLYPFLTSYYIYLFRFICIPSMRFGDWRLSLASRQRPSRSYSIFMQPNPCHSTWRVVHDFFSLATHLLGCLCIAKLCTFDHFRYSSTTLKGRYGSTFGVDGTRAPMIQIHPDRRR